MKNKTDYRNNCISLLRFLAAFQVMWGHMLSHLDLELWGGYRLCTIIGEVLYFFLGVPLFFFLSGYLIWISLDGTLSRREYFKRRVLRIYPELWVGVAVELLTIIIFYEKKIEWGKLILFGITQSTVLQFWTPEFLREYGCGTPNGSLWTICVFVQFYIFIWIIKDRIKGRGLRFWIISFGVFVILGSFTRQLEGRIPDLLYKLYNQTLFQYLWIFWIGIIIAQYRDKMILFLKARWWIFGICAIIWRGVRIDIYSRAYPVLFCLLCFAAALGFAYRCPRLKLKTDMSYGMFIYHMIVVNILITFGIVSNAVSLFLAVLASLIFAWFSTTVVAKNSTHCFRKKLFN